MVITKMLLLEINVFAMRSNYCDRRLAKSAPLYTRRDARRPYLNAICGLSEHDALYRLPVSQNNHSHCHRCRHSAMKMIHFLIHQAL